MRKRLQWAAMLVAMAMLLTSCLAPGIGEETPEEIPNQSQSAEESSAESGKEEPEKQRESSEESPDEDGDWPKYRFARLDGGYEAGRYWGTFVLEFLDGSCTIDYVNAKIKNTKTDTEIEFANSERIVFQGEICTTKDRFIIWGHDNDNRSWQNDRKIYTFLLFSDKEGVIPEGNEIEITANGTHFFLDEDGKDWSSRFAYTFKPNSKTKKLTMSKGDAIHGSSIFKVGDAYFVWNRQEITEDKNLTDEGTFTYREYSFQQVGGQRLDPEEFADNFRICMYDSATERYQEYYPVLPFNDRLEVDCEVVDMGIYPVYRLDIGYIIGKDGSTEVPYRIEQTYDDWRPMLVSDDRETAFAH